MLRIADALRIAATTLRAAPPREPDHAAAFEIEGLARAVRGARAFGYLAIALLFVGAALSWASWDAHAPRLLLIRAVGATAIGLVLWQLRSTERYPRPSSLLLVLLTAATVDMLALYSGPAASVQHDRLNAVVLGSAVLLTWPPVWQALASLGVLGVFLLGHLSTSAHPAAPVFPQELGYLIACGAGAIAISGIRERHRLEVFGMRTARDTASRRGVEQESRYRSVVETVASAIILTSPNNRILEFNAEAERLYGRRREDVLGKDYVGLFVPERLWPVAREIVRRVLNGRRSIPAEAAIKRPDGSKRIVLWMNACLRDADGRPIALLAAGQDVTERKRTERALEEREAQLRRLVETTKAIPWEADLASGRFTYVGPQAASLGYPLSQWQEPDFWERHVHPDDHDRVLEHCLTAMQRQTEYDCEYRMVAADGRIVWLHDLVSVERRQGAPRMLRGLMIDVTERKESEEEIRRLNAELEARVVTRTAELRESEARLRSIFEASPIGMAVVDDEARLVEENAALGTLLGGHDTRELADIVHPDDAARLLEALTALRTRQADVRTVDMRFVRRDGTVMWAHTALVAAGSDRGERRVFAMVQDDTARKREEALAGGERRALRTLAQGGGLGNALGALLECLERNEPEMICSILVADERGQRLRHGAAPRLDDAYARLVDGTEVGPTAGSCGTAAFRRARVVVEDIAHDPLWEAGRTEALSRGLRACWSQPILSATGQLLGTFALYYRTTKAPTEPEISLIVAAARTAAIVIERQHLDDLLARHRNQLAHAGRVSLLAAMAAGLAHEMQQPLAAIVNYAGACERLLLMPAFDQGQLLDGMGRIQSTVLRAGQIVRSIRSLAQKSEPRRERLDLNDVARSAIRFIEGEARRSAVAIVLELDAFVSPVQVDRIQIEQVILNLLGNALEAMAAESRGDLLVRTLMRDDATVAVAIRDTGSGIPPEVESRMFDPFFTTKPLGLGMGLSIGRMIVEAHGGVMWSASDADGGTTVGFTLPAADPVRRAASGA